MSLAHENITRRNFVQDDTMLEQKISWRRAFEVYLVVLVLFSPEINAQLHELCMQM